MARCCSCQAAAARPVDASSLGFKFADALLRLGFEFAEPRSVLERLVAAAAKQLLHDPSMLSALNLPTRRFFSALNSPSRAVPEWLVAAAAKRLLHGPSMLRLSALNSPTRCFVWALNSPSRAVFWNGSLPLLPSSCCMTRRCFVSFHFAYVAERLEAARPFGSLRLLLLICTAAQSR